MPTIPKNFFNTSEDLKVLTDKCVYISTHNADMAITSKGNLFIKLKVRTRNRNKIIEKMVSYLIKEGWKIKQTCNIFVY